VLTTVGNGENMDSKEAAKKKVNTAASGPQKLGFHSGRKHPQPEKVVDAKHDGGSSQRKALKQREYREAGNCNE